MQRLKLLLLTLALLVTAIIGGGLTAAASGKYISHVEPGSECTPLDQSAEIEALCRTIESDNRIYGWPFPAYIQNIAPGLPEEAYERIDIDWYVPVVGIALMDGIFANWAFYSLVFLTLLAVPFLLLMRRLRLLEW